MKSRLLTVLAVTLGLVLAACGGSSDGSDDSDLTWALSAAPRSLDPAHAFDTDSMVVVNEVLEPLVSLGSEGELVPRLAEQWSQPDPLTYVYELNSGVTFWDGSELTADDVAFSIERHRDPAVASELGSYVKNVASVTATGPLEVTITMSTPTPEFQYSVALVSHTVKKDFALEQGEELGNSKALTMGTGPYEVDSFSAQGVELTQNTEYWGDSAAWETISFDVIPDSETRRLALQAGEIDGTFAVPPQESRTWESLDGVVTEYVSAPVSTMLSMDTTVAPWDDVHVRRAVAHAIDRESLVTSVFNGRARVVESVVDPLLWEYVGTGQDEIDAIYDGLPTYEFDVDKALDELSMSAHPDGFEFELQYPAERSEIGKALQVVVANLAEVGITLTLKEVPLSTWIGDIYAHENLGVQVIPLGADYPDPGFVKLLFGEANAGPNGFNLANFAPGEVEDLLVQEASPDATTRTDAIAGIMEIAAEQLPYVPLYFADAGLALSDELVYDGAYSYFVPYFREWATDIQAAG